MIKKKEDKRKEKVATKYLRVRKTIQQICDDFSLPSEKFLTQFPEEIAEKCTEIELCGMVQEANAVIRRLIKDLCFADWGQTIVDNFDETQQKSVAELVSATIQCDAANAYSRFSEIFALLQALNDEQKKDVALVYLEEFCSANSFEDLINHFDLIFKSKHAKEVARARDRGFERQKVFGKRREKGYRAYFNASEKKRDSKQLPDSEEIFANEKVIG